MGVLAFQVVSTNGMVGVTSSDTTRWGSMCGVFVLPGDLFPHVVSADTEGVGMSHHLGGDVACFDTAFGG